MKNEIQVYSTPIKGTPQELEKACRIAINKGASEYDCTGGNIIFCKVEKESEYLLRMLKGNAEMQKRIMERLKEIESEKKMVLNEEKNIPLNG